MKENTYQDLINNLVEEILETTGTGGVAIGPGNSLGTMRHQERSPDPVDLKLDPADIKLIPSIYKHLVPTKQVISKENFKYDEKRGDHIVKSQHAKTADWLRAIMQGQVEAQKNELTMQKRALALTTAEHAHELDFQKQKLGLDAKRMALKAKFAPTTPKPANKKKK